MSRRAYVPLGWAWPCLLCQGKAAYGGVFVPRVPLAFGIAHGHFIYYLCAPCFRRPSITEEVEQRILALANGSLQ